MTTEYVRLLMYFILTMGIVLIGILLVSFVELQKGNNLIEQAYHELNQTSASVNQTKLFIEQTEHDDDRQERVNQIEMQGRSNQTRTIMNNTQDLLEAHHNGLVLLTKELKDYIQRYNNTTEKTFRIIKDAMDQNQGIIDILVNISKNQANIQKQIEGNATDTNTQVSKWGPENNALGRAILEKMGVNATKIIEKEVYGNQTLKNMILP